MDVCGMEDFNVAVLMLNCQIFWYNLLENKTLNNNLSDIELSPLHLHIPSPFLLIMRSCMYVVPSAVFKCYPHTHILHLIAECQFIYNSLSNSWDIQMTCRSVGS